MQEHIRRAHPLYYTPKLPANEESFRIMVNSAPSEKPKTTTEIVTETPSLFDLQHVMHHC